MSTRPTLALIGHGAMGSAMLRGWHHTYPDSPVTVYVPTDASRQKVPGHAITPDTLDATVRDRDLIVLAVKPHLYPELIRTVRATLKPGSCIVSVTPAYTLASLRLLLERDDVAVVRTMPNMAAALGLGVTGFVTDPELDPTIEAAVLTFLSSFGEVVRIAETQIAALSSLTGSSPAYLAMVLEALTEGAVALGLPAAIARPLAASTMLGTATWVREEGLHPAVLRDQVCSAGGTSIAGVHILEHGFKGQLIDAMMASADRFHALERETSDALHGEQARHQPDEKGHRDD